MNKQNRKNTSTSWEPVANWYDKMLGGEDTYQSKVILPNLLRLLPPEKKKKVLDVACGQGFFSKVYAENGATVLGLDVSQELIKRAKVFESENLKFIVSSAVKMDQVKSATFDNAIIVLALQNIKDISQVIKEIYRVLKQNGKLVIVLNHPAFRVLKGSSWGFDEEKNVQYRRLDKYALAFETKVDMTPGEASEEKKVYTVSFHRPIQDYFKAIISAGFSVSGLEEWISHKQSQKGPRAVAEDTARKEFPMFLTIMAKK